MIAVAARARVWVLCAGFALFVPLGLLAKQSMATSYIAIAVLVLLASGLINPRSLMPSRLLVLAAGALAIYVAAIHLMVSTCDPCLAKAAGKLPMLGLILWAAGSTAGVLEPEDRPLVGRALIGGLAVALVILMFELSTDASFYRMLTGREDDPDVPLFRYNRGTSALVLLAWPAAAWAWSARRRGLAVGLLVLTVAAAGHGDSASALGAGLLALAVAGFAALAPVLTLNLGLMVVTVFAVLTPFIFINLLGWVRPIIDTIPPSVLDRIEIWHHGAKAVFEAPVFGHGIGVIRHLPLADQSFTGYRHLVKPPTHPHDAALQIWLELGAIGVILFAFLVWVVARGSRGLEKSWRVAALAAGAGIVFTALVSYGLWQETWLGIIGMTALGFRALAPGAGSR